MVWMDAGSRVLTMVSCCVLLVEMPTIKCTLLAAVATETYESWYWFLGLLQKDLNISNGGEAWVIISDQQKVLLLHQLLIIWHMY